MATTTTARGTMRTTTTAAAVIAVFVLLTGCSIVSSDDETNPKWGRKFAAAGCQQLLTDDTLFKSTDPADIRRYADEHRAASVGIRHAAELDSQWRPLADAIDTFAAALDQAAEAAQAGQATTVMQEPAVTEAASIIRTDCPSAIREAAADG
ncbi:hypothetical protein OOK58_42875 [Streptomyces sp. NBC_01728]|uniref:hypothetical protein n=1 Tax=unclassified Streptomyces TaxID=2593676 RepID=UPI00225A3F2A|nr:MULTISPECIES: hypothetical protein [unclassified Streptomyces]MCX4458656.1 hypothetical protein [Streptomyces sp. NBC_01719]MCX4498013.1 hypothetical protein [Streptomyces sp. NBC_01728]